MYLHVPDIQNGETDSTDTTTKKSSLYAFDNDNIVKKRVTGKTVGGKFALDVNSTNGATETTLQSVDNKLGSVFDYLELTYTGDNLTGLVYKNGGASGTTIATVALGYTGDNLTSITKT